MALSVNCYFSTGEVPQGQGLPDPVSAPVRPGRARELRLNEL